MKKETIKEKITQLEQYREQCKAEMYVTIGKIVALEEMLQAEENKGLEIGKENNKDGEKS